MSVIELSIIALSFKRNTFMMGSKNTKYNISCSVVLCTNPKNLNLSVSEEWR